MTKLLKIKTSISIPDNVDIHVNEPFSFANLFYNLSRYSTNYSQKFICDVFDCIGQSAEDRTSEDKIRFFKSDSNEDLVLDKTPDTFSLHCNSKTETKLKLNILIDLLDKYFKNQFVVCKSSEKNWPVAEEDINLPIIYDDYHFEYQTSTEKKITKNEALIEIANNFDNSIEFLVVVYPSTNVITCFYLGQCYMHYPVIASSYFFGNFYQKENSEIDKYKTRIKWKILDVQGDNSLLLSSKVLYKPLSNMEAQRFLQNFIHESFSKDEIGRIKKVRAEPIFLLNKGDVSNYLENIEKRIAFETDYSNQKSNNEIVFPFVKKDCNWLLDSSNSEIPFVNKNGEIVCGAENFETNRLGLRPAMWVNFDIPAFSDLGENSLKFIEECVINQRSFLIHIKRLNLNALLGTILFIISEKTSINMNQVLPQKVLDEINSNGQFFEIETFNVDWCAFYVHSLIAKITKHNNSIFTVNGISVHLDCCDFINTKNNLSGKFKSIPDQSKTFFNENPHAHNEWVRNHLNQSKVCHLVLTDTLVQEYSRHINSKDNAEVRKDNSLKNIAKILTKYDISSDVEWIIMKSKADLDSNEGTCVYVVNLKEIGLR